MVRPSRRAAPRAWPSGCNGEQPACAAPSGAAWGEDGDRDRPGNQVDRGWRSARPHGVHAASPAAQPAPPGRSGAEAVAAPAEGVPVAQVEANMSDQPDLTESLALAAADAVRARRAAIEAGGP